MSVSGSKRKAEEEKIDSKEAEKSVKTPSKEDKKSKSVAPVTAIAFDASLAKDTKQKKEKVLEKIAEPDEVIEKVATKKAKKSSGEAAPVTKKVKIDESKNILQEINTKSPGQSTKDHIDTPAKPKRPESGNDNAKKSAKSPAASAPAAPSTPSSSKSEEPSAFIGSPKFQGAKEGYFFGKVRGFDSSTLTCIYVYLMIFLGWQRIRLLSR